MKNADGKRTIRIGNDVLEINDPLLVQPASADLIVDGRTFNGIVSIGFATIFCDGDNGATAQARVCARVRMNLTSALDLRNLLNKLLEDTIPSKEKAN